MSETTISEPPPPETVQGCAQHACTRRVEWQMTAVDHDGAVLGQWYACHDTDHRGRATAAARRVCDGRVEIRMVEGS